VESGISSAAVPPRQTEARRIAEAVLQLLEMGAEAATEDLSWETAEQARARTRTVYRGLRELGGGDVTVTVRRGSDGRWRWYARRVARSGARH
jgi:hypothetical protein